MTEDNYERDRTINPCDNCIWARRFGYDKCKTCRHRNQLYPTRLRFTAIPDGTYKLVRCRK